MTTDLLPFVIQELKDYKTNKEILEQLQLEDVSISAAALSDMPKSITNKFSSVTENMALWKQDEQQVLKSIKRVESWLRLLNYIERFVITGFYIEEYSYLKIIREWKQHDDIYYSERFWRHKKKQSLHKICNFYMKKLP